MDAPFCQPLAFSVVTHRQIKPQIVNESTPVDRRVHATQDRVETVDQERQRPIACSPSELRTRQPQDMSVQAYCAHRFVTETAARSGPASELLATHCHVRPLVRGQDPTNSLRSWAQASPEHPVEICSRQIPAPPKIIASHHQTHSTNADVSHRPRIDVHVGRPVIRDQPLPQR